MFGEIITTRIRTKIINFLKKLGDTRIVDFLNNIWMFKGFFLERFFKGFFLRDNQDQNRQFLKGLLRYGKCIFLNGI